MSTGDDLRRELLGLRRADRETTERLAATGELYEGYAERMGRVHVANAERLERIIAAHGWPGLSLVGDDGAEAAWLIAQHAIGRPAFQRRCLDLLREAVEAGEAPPRHVAHLTDRIRFNERRPQVYGTIFDWDENGEMSPWVIERPETVDDRRRRVGLPRLAKAIRRARERPGFGGRERPPGDFAVRQREIEAWARRVGWLPREARS